MLSSVYRVVASCWATEPEEVTEEMDRLDALRRGCRQLHAFLQVEDMSVVRAPAQGPTCLFCCGMIFNENGARSIVAKCGHAAVVCATCAVGARSPLLLTECRACALNCYYE